MTLDDYGNSTPDWGASATTTVERGVIDETQSTEIASGRDTIVTDLLAILPADSVVTSHSRVLQGTKTYEVVGDPIVRDTFSPGTHHTEAHLIRSTG